MGLHTVREALDFSQPRSDCPPPCTKTPSATSGWRRSWSARRPVAHRPPHHRRRGLSRPVPRADEAGHHRRRAGGQPVRPLPRRAHVAAWTRPPPIRIMKAVSRIAQTGRSPCCAPSTSPSAELFFMFDRLLLLRSAAARRCTSETSARTARGPRQLLRDLVHQSKHPPQSASLARTRPTGCWTSSGPECTVTRAGPSPRWTSRRQDWHAIWQKSKPCARRRLQGDQLSVPSPATRARTPSSRGA